MLKKLNLIIIIFFMSTTSKAIYYTVSFNKVKSHYVTVKLDFEIKGKDFVDFKVTFLTITILSNNNPNKIN